MNATITLKFKEPVTLQALTYILNELASYVGEDAKCSDHTMTIEALPDTESIDEAKEILEEFKQSALQLSVEVAYQIEEQA